MTQRIRHVATAFAVGLPAAVLPGCRPVPAGPAARVVPAAQNGLFRNVAAAAGVDFTFTNGGSGRHYMVETVGAGCAFFDYNQDGFPDLLYLQSGALPWDRKPGAGDRTDPANRLYLNNGNGTFKDVTAGSGLEDTGYSQGVAVGDVDRDGYPDVFVTAYGGNRLFLNQKGSGRFRDVTSTAGVADTAAGKRWCTSAAFGDYDGDGWLDLYVCRYAVWSREKDQPCKNPRGQSSYCSPEIYDPDVHALYRNNRNGTFSDVSRAAGIESVRGRGLGIAWLDYDGDGREDIFVANDLNPFMLWRNRGDGTFENRGEAAGVAYSDMGRVLAGMGVGVRDYNGDGREDLFVTNFSGQMNALYRADAGGLFTNVTTPSGVGPASFDRLGFGCEFIDFDRDGRPDLVVGNGHVNEDVAAYTQGVEYAEPKSLLRNKGDGTFEDLRSGIGDLSAPHVTRGLAVADFDRDGHLDIAANNQDGPAELLRYQGPDRGHWIAVEARGVRSNRDGYHARVTLRAGGKTQTAEVRSGSSFASHSEPRVYFGTGEATTVEELRITWHGSRNTTVSRNLSADRAYRATEGGSVLPLQPGTAGAR